MTQAVRNITDFLNLSALINYQLSAVPVNWQAVLSLTVGDRFTEEEDHILIELLALLNDAYGQRKRRLGPYAVLHPIRSMALLFGTLEKAVLSDAITILLHDKDEDIRQKDFSPEHWLALSTRFEQWLEQHDAGERSLLVARLDHLTTRKNELYYNYIGRIMEKAREVPEIVRVKLADRLDNTLDLRMDLQDASACLDCFELVFGVLFLNSPHKQPGRRLHPVQGKIDGAHRLYQLFKNAVFLSLLRREKLDKLDESTSVLFTTLARASLAEAQRNLAHLFTYHITQTEAKRAIVTSVMEYCQAGAISMVTDYGRRHRLDGLFKHHFDHETKAIREQHLTELYQDKPFMAEISLAFTAVFHNFLVDPDFLIRGIDPLGIHPELSDPGPAAD